MNDSFAVKVYPTIHYVLDVLDRIRAGVGSEPTPQEIFPRLKQFLGQLDSRANDARDFDLAKHALCYWIDEVLINSSWSHAGYWKDHTLERDLYDARDRAWEFFEKAKTAKSLSHPEALETFYLCVALGFQGVYREGAYRPATAGESIGPTTSKGTADLEKLFDDMPAAAGGQETWGLTGKFTAPKRPEPEKLAVPGRGPQGAARDLPATLQEWATPVYSQLCPGGLRPFQPTEPVESQRDARPLLGRRTLMRSGVVLGWLMFLLIALGIANLFFK